jgi:hypothetical protein
MNRTLKTLSGALVGAGLVVTTAGRPVAQMRSLAVAVGMENAGRLRDWDGRIDRMSRVGELELRDEHQDTLLPNRRHERLRQLYHGIPVLGGDVARQTERGETVSIFGSIYDDITIDPSPRLLPEEARDIISRLSGVDLESRLPQLFVLPSTAAASRSRVPRPGDQRGGGVGVLHRRDDRQPAPETEPVREPERASAGSRRARRHQEGQRPLAVGHLHGRRPAAPARAADI